jgi:hypothetical protein
MIIFILRQQTTTRCPCLGDIFSRKHACNKRTLSKVLNLSFSSICNSDHCLVHHREQRQGTVLSLANFTKRNSWQMSDLSFTKETNSDGHLINFTNSSFSPHYLHVLHFHVHFTIFPCINTQPPIILND